MPTPSKGDYGMGFLVLRCDVPEQTFELQPLIVWNEAFDSIRPDVEKNGGRILRSDGLYVSASSINNFEERCDLGKLRVTVRLPSVYAPLEILEGNERIAVLKIGDVWTFWGYEFRLRRTPTKGWEELCGRVDGLPDWRTFDRSRRDTNCRVRK